MATNDEVQEAAEKALRVIEEAVQAAIKPVAELESRLKSEQAASRGLLARVLNVRQHIAGRSADVYLFTMSDFRKETL